MRLRAGKTNAVDQREPNSTSNPTIECKSTEAVSERWQRDVPLLDEVDQVVHTERHEDQRADEKVKNEDVPKVGHA